MKPRIFSVLLVLSFFVVSLALVKVVRGQLPKRRPFTATAVETRYGSDGVKAYQETYTFAVRSDGSQAKAVNRRARDGNWYEMRMVVDIPRRRRVSIDPITQSITTYNLSAGEAALLALPDRSCQGIDGGDANLLGYVAKRVVENLQFRDGKVQGLESWRAPALDCFPLREIDSQGPLGGNSPRNLVEVVTVIEGEPASSMFEVPASYAERSPSDVVSEFNRRFGSLGRPLSESTASKLDRVYQSYR